MRYPRRVLRRASLTVLLLSACEFAPVVPPGAVILCVDDTECPDGLVCDERHECVQEGAVAPTLVEARFEPAFARVGDTVRLTVVADLPVADASLTYDAGSEDAGLVAVTEGASATIVLERTVDEAMLEGSYRLASVTLQGEDGASAVYDLVETGFVVDKTAPTLRNPRADDGTPADGLTLADTAGFDAFNLAVDISEPFKDVEVTLGSLSTTAGDIACEANPLVSLGVVCSGTIAAGTVADGDNLVTITATDLAGNPGSVQLSLPADAAAPRVDPATTTVDITGAGGVQLAALVLSGRMRVSFVADEALGATPEVKLEAGLLATEVTVTGRRVDAEIPVLDDTIGPGPHRVLATLTDVVGHAAEVVVPLPAPFEDGVPLTEGPVSQCLVVDELGVVTCPDFDGDGFRGGAPGCDDQLADDCDDLDAAVHPGGFEIPGDGLDNDCAGDGDLLVDEANGVFADPAAAAGGDGTRASPFNDLDVAHAAAKAADKPFIFAAAGAQSFPGLTLLEVSLIGGFDPSTWERGGLLTTVGFLERVPAADEVGLVGVDLVTVDGAGHVTVIDADVRTVTGASVECVRSSLGNFDQNGVGARPSRVVACEMSTFDFRSTNATVVRTVVTFDAFVGARANVDFVDSVALGGVEVFDSAFRAFHSVVSGSQGKEALSADLFSEVTLVNSALKISASATEAMIIHPDTRLLMHATIFPDQGDIMAGFPADASGLAALEACDYARCTSASGNALGEYIFGPTPFRVDGASVGLVQDTGVNPFEFGGPAALARDGAEGDCRPRAGFYDIGPDEL
jgi:hypothetical protein